MEKYTPIPNKTTPKQYNPAIFDNKKVAITITVKPLAMHISSIYFINTFNFITLSTP